MFLYTLAAPENVVYWRGKTRQSSPTALGVFYSITSKALHWYVSRAYTEDQDIPRSLVPWNNGAAPEIKSNLICGELGKFVSVVVRHFFVVVQHIFCIHSAPDSIRDSLFTKEMLINQITLRVVWISFYNLNSPMHFLSEKYTPVFSGTDHCCDWYALVKSSLSSNILVSQVIAYLMISEDWYSPNTTIILQMNLK